jgi:hypothetical protein
VTKGKLGIYDTDKEIVLLPGQKYTIKPNSKHRFFNASETEELTMIVELKPALKSEYFFETMYELACQGKVNKDALPGTLQFAAILNEYYGELFAVGPPIIAQKIMAKVVGSFAKLIGYKGYIPFNKQVK